MRRRAFIATPLLLLAPHARAAVAYPEVTPGRALQFPQDYGSHPAFRNEWWYITGWLDDGSRNQYGFQITFFRNRPGVAEDSASAFAPRQLLFAHAALADPRLGRLRHGERSAREGFDLATAREGDTDVWIGDWSLKRADNVYRTRIAARDFAFDLQFTPTQPVLLEGDAGVSHKGPLPGQASYYYSEPHLAVTGTLTIAGAKSSVASAKSLLAGGNSSVAGAESAISSGGTSVTGVAWLDHEWSSEYMAPEASGWDWTGINFDDGGALMAFRMRDRTGAKFWAAGSYRSADGRVRMLQPSEIDFTPQRRWRSPRTQVEYPVAMTIRAGELSYALEPLIDDQELDTRSGIGVLYWEGAVHATVPGQAVGRGYLELTGYGKPLKL